jgi:hypothetical protein
LCDWCRSVSVEILGEEELLGLEGSTREDLLTLGQEHYRYQGPAVWASACRRDPTTGLLGSVTDCGEVDLM